MRGRGRLQQGIASQQLPRTQSTVSYGRGGSPSIAHDTCKSISASRESATLGKTLAAIARETQSLKHTRGIRATICRYVGKDSTTAPPGGFNTTAPPPLTPSKFRQPAE